MNVRKFFGPSTRDALRQVRDALGADALILSNRKVDGGVEIMAVMDGEVEALTYGNPIGHPQQPPVQQPPLQTQPPAAPSIAPETISPKIQCQWCRDKFHPSICFWTASCVASWYCF